MRLKFLVTAAAITMGAASLQACTTTEQGAAAGTVAGAAIGGATTGTVEGAIVGGAIGAATGALIGRANDPGQCYYRDRYGRRYIAACPRNY